MPKQTAIIPAEQIEQKILLVRGQKVMLDQDLAELYGVETRILNRAVGRNKTRFPDDFMFELSPDEWRILKSQFGISSWGGRRRSRPKAFTEQGVAMLSSVLRSPRAIRVNVEIMRAFVRLRQMMSEHRDLARRLDQLERKYDRQFAHVFEAIRQLMVPVLPAQKKAFGFKGKTENAER